MVEALAGIITWDQASPLSAVSYSKLTSSLISQPNIRALPLSTSSFPFAPGHGTYVFWVLHDIRVNLFGILLLSFSLFVENG